MSKRIQKLKDQAASLKAKKLSYVKKINKLLEDPNASKEGMPQFKKLGYFENQRATLQQEQSKINKKLREIGRVESDKEEASKNNLPYEIEGSSK